MTKIPDGFRFLNQNDWPDRTIKRWITDDSDVLVSIDNPMEGIKDITVIERHFMKRPPHGTPSIYLIELWAEHDVNLPWFIQIWLWMQHILKLKSK